MNVKQKILNSMAHSTYYIKQKKYFPPVAKGNTLCKIFFLFFFLTSIAATLCEYDYLIMKNIRKIFFKYTLLKLTVQ